MKTETRNRILKLIETRGSIRPVTLRQELKISGVALHRHLSRLLKDEVIEARGSPPFTEYQIAGTPNLEAVSQWVNALTMKSSPAELVCETRSIFAARLPRLTASVKAGLPSESLPLVISAAGEVGNNSFDHNLGQWRDVAGCWFESQATGKFFWVCIADRGQGVYASLIKVHPELIDEQTALRAAFEKMISGRAPEQRGNGLKFVSRTIVTLPGSGIACISGSGRVSYGDEGARCLEELNKHFTTIKGTVTLMVWRLQ